MISSLIFHLLIIFLSVFFARKGVKKNNVESGKFSLNAWYIASFATLLCFIGGREFVGRDWFNYQDIYEMNTQMAFILGETREFGFLFLIKYLNQFNCDFSVFIFLISALTLVLFYLPFRKSYYLLPYAIFFFFVGISYTTTINTIRQAVALFCFFNILACADEWKENWKQIAFFAVLGFSFHYTLILALPFVLLFNRQWTTRKMLVIICSTFIASFLFFSVFSNYVLNYMPKYDSYLSDDSIIAKNSTFGLGASLLLVLRLLPAFSYGRIKEHFPSFQGFYILYYIGLAIYYSSYKYLLIVRFTFYFQVFEIVVFSIFVYVLFKKKNSLFALGYIVLWFFNYIYLYGDFVEDQILSNKFSLFFLEFSK